MEKLIQIKKSCLMKFITNYDNLNCQFSPPNLSMMFKLNQKYFSMEAQLCSGTTS